MARTVSIPGFRKGRTPTSLIQKRFRKEIEQEVVEKLTRDYSLKIIEERELVPLEPPVVDEYHCEEGEPLTFRTSFEVRPAIELGKYRGLEVVRRREGLAVRGVQAFVRL